MMPKNMLCSWDKKKAMKELEQGRELTYQLRDLLSKSSNSMGLGLGLGLGEEEEDLVLKIFNSFANSISMLTSTCNYEEDEAVSRNPNNNHTSWDDLGISAQIKDPSGCYKRRNAVAEWSRTIDTPSEFDDGHAWRKYGQKQILNANHPRNYFRCTHRSDQNCQATKQVQKIGDDPPKYRTTYYGHHTCKNHHHHLLINASDSTFNSNSNSMLLSFANNNNLVTNKHDNSSFLLPFQSQPSVISPISISSSDHDQYLLMSPPHHLRALESSSSSSAHHHHHHHQMSADHTDRISGVVASVDLHDLLDF